MFGTRKLGRTSDQRKAMLRAMTTYLFENGKIETTFTRAKEVQPVAEPLARRTPWLPTAEPWRISPRKMLPTSCSRRSLRSMPTATAATPV